MRAGTYVNSERVMSRYKRQSRSDGPNLRRVRGGCDRNPVLAAINVETLGTLRLQGQAVADRLGPSTAGIWPQIWSTVNRLIRAGDSSQAVEVGSKIIVALLTTERTGDRTSLEQQLQEARSQYLIDGF